MPEYRIIDIDKEHVEEKSEKKNTILIDKIDKDNIYIASVTGRMKIGVFIKIPEIGSSLIPAKHLIQIGKSIKDYKKGMQVKVQLLGVNEEGPAHDKRFTVDVVIDNIVYGTGIGTSKKDARWKKQISGFWKSQRRMH